MICPFCGSSYGKKRGVRNGKQRWSCHTCGKYSITPDGPPTKSLPRILLFDVETSFYHFTGWGTYKQYIDHYRITKHQYILSWAAKWLYDDEIMSDIVTPKEAKARDDKRVLKSIWKLLDESDIVIGHNSERFDIRKLNWRFISHRIPPPSPYKTIDTLKISRREFFAPSHKQAFLTEYLGAREKLDTNYALWQRCEAGEKKALDEMVEYNRRDVVGLEEVYLIIRPYIHNHPNLGVLMDEDVCTNCGSKSLEETDSVYLTTANKFLVYRCDDCKTPFIRSKKNINERPTNLRSVAR